MRKTFGFLLSCSVAACVGEIGDGPADTVQGPAPTPQSCTGAPTPGDSPIRRMTRFEYNNTVRDLLGDTTNPADGFGAEEEALGFNNNAQSLTTTAALAEKYMLAAEDIAHRATEDMTAPLPNGKPLVPCDPTAIGEEACGLEFIETFGARAFRRPLQQDERDMFVALFEHGRADGGFRLGVEMVIQAALQAPQFLYRIELGLPEDAGAPVVRLDPWEMASRLSYFLWGTMPDDELFEAAVAGELVTPEQIAAQARRMLDDDRARAAVENFHAQWLDYYRIASVGKNAALFPDWSPAIGQLMLQETRAFVEHVVFDGEGTLSALLTAPYSFMNAELAAFYGIEGVTVGSDFEKVDLDPEQRAGLLTTGTLLTLNAHSNQTSPVHRGKLVREQILCDVMPLPPPNVMITVPEPDPNSTAKERFAEHSKNPSCSGCHQLMDPIGFGFENYDAVARFRTMENGKPIDATGVLTQSDVDGEFDGVVELAAKLASSDDVRRCYATQWFRYAYGRGETKEDLCTTAWLADELAAKGGNVKELLVALTQTDAFLFRKAGGEP